MTVSLCVSTSLFQLPGRSVLRSFDQILVTCQGEDLFFILFSENQDTFSYQKSSFPHTELKQGRGPGHLMSPVLCLVKDCAESDLSAHYHFSPPLMRIKSDNWLLPELCSIILVTGSIRLLISFCQD